jgi:cytochrome c biogenesis protein CcmG/thiol:disulfide interchange protein DsbE
MVVNSTFIRTSLLRITILLLASLAAIVLYGCKASTPAQIGTVAPDFSVADGNRTITLSQFRGKPVMLNFWATWCPPCVEEMPSMVDLQKRLGDKVVILAVSTDVDEDAFKKFTATRTQGLLTVRDGDHKSNALYGTWQFPETYVIDREGVIRRKFIGPQDWNSPDIIEYFSKL